MKKKLLFVIPSLELGGAEKSLVNLLNCIDFTKYEVDVFLFSKKGIFLDLLPKEVNVLSTSVDFEVFSLPFSEAVFQFLKKGKINLAINKIIFSAVNFWSKNTSKTEQKSWKYLNKFFSEIEKKYDVSIAYLEKSAMYFVADKTKAQKKIAWLHTDIKSLELDLNFEKNYFHKFTKIVTVSDFLVKKYKTYFPEIAEKFFSIENINSPKIITALAEKSCNYQFEDKVFKIVYVGRLAAEKTLHLAINAIEILRKKNYNVELFLVGDGNQKEMLLELANEKELADKIHLLGAQSNPYPFIKNADLFIMTSAFEGKSIALEEAKILEKPIVITNFTTAKDQIEDGKTGLIADMNAESIADKIEIIITNNEFRSQIIENLQLLNLGNETEVEKLYHIINE